MEVWLSSDHHFGHGNIIDFCERPWGSVEHMNEDLISLWNETVSPGDHVFYLGDFALGPVETVEKITPRLNGVKHLVTGNHDRCWTGKAKGYKFMDLYTNSGWVSVQSSMMFRGVLFNHFPYEEDDRHGSKYSGFRPSRNEWGNRRLAHGHVHTSWTYQNNQVNVGVDVWDYRPVNFDDVLATFEKGETVD